MIEIRELTKSFQGNKVLDQVSWSVEKNRTIGLLGPNGAGKSTTMKIITGLLSPSGGGVWIDEQNVHQNPVEAKAKIGFLPETPPLYQELSVHRFFKFICGLKGIKSIEQQNEIDRVVEKLGLESVLHKSCGVLSKGFRQRLGIAQALLGNPKILIFDEPSVGLDPQQVYELRETIRSLKDQHTIILSTHVLSEVQQICDDVVILDHGVVKAFGPLDQILEGQKRGRSITIEASGLTDKVLTHIQKMPDVLNARRSGGELKIDVSMQKNRDVTLFLDFLINEKCRVFSVNQEENSLEDFFIEVIK